MTCNVQCLCLVYQVCNIGGSSPESSNLLTLHQPTNTQPLLFVGSLKIGAEIITLVFTMTKLSLQAFLTLGKGQSNKLQFNDDMSVGWL